MIEIIKLAPELRCQLMSILCVVLFCVSLSQDGGSLTVPVEDSVVNRFSVDEAILKGLEFVYHQALSVNFHKSHLLQPL